jgi:hypothetical protein
LISEPSPVPLGVIASLLVLFLIVGFANAFVCASIDDPAIAIVSEMLSG